MSVITSGIKNALERGESMEQAIQSFQNAGYSEDEISKAVDEIRGWNQYGSQNSGKAINSTLVSSTQIVKEEKLSKEGYKKLPRNSFEAISKKIYLPYLLIGLLGLLFIIGAALLGLYWNKLF